MNLPKLTTIAITAVLLPPAVACSTVVLFAAGWVIWLGDVARARRNADDRTNARTRVYCTALHWDDQTCPRCCPEVALAEAVEAVHAPLSWELAKTPAVRDMSLIDSAAFLATARDIDGLSAYVEREWVR